MYIHIHIYIYVYVFRYGYVYVYAYVYVHVYLGVDVCAHRKRIDTWMHIGLYINTACDRFALEL